MLSTKTFISEFDSDLYLSTNYFSSSLANSMTEANIDIMAVTISQYGESNTALEYTSYVYFSSQVNLQKDNSLSYSVVVNTDDEAYLKFTESSSAIYAPNLTHVSSGGNDLSYSISDGPTSVSSWIQIDSTTGLLTIDTPPVGDINEYSFTINTKSSKYLSGAGVNKLMTIRINACSVPGGITCNPLDYTICNNTVTCGDGIIQSVFGEQCDDGNTAGGDGCNQYGYTESGYNGINYSTKPSFGYPIGGDKTIQTSPILEECDDGNNMNYDGGSANGKVEANYVCSTNSKGYSDGAIQHSPPNAIGSSLDIDSHQITIEFDQIMLNQSITNTDIKLEIDGPNSPYFTSWTSNFYQKLLIISFSSSPVLIGGKNEVITVKLENVLKFKNEYYAPITNEKTFELDVPNFSINPKVQSISNGASYAFLLTMLLSICVSILTGGSIELMWSFANTIQMLFFISALDLYFPQDLIYVFSLMKYSNFDNPLFSYIKEELSIMPNLF